MKKFYTLVCTLVLGGAWVSAQEASINGTEYDTFADAWSKATTGQTITLLKDVDFGNTPLAVGNNKKITVTSDGGHTYAIKRTSGDVSMFTISTRTAGLTFENVVLDGGNLESSSPLVVASGIQAVTVTFKDSKIVNAKNSGDTGILNLVGNKGTYNIDGLTIENCEVGSKAELVWDYTSTSTRSLAGANTLSVYVDPGKYIDVEKVTGGNIAIVFDPNSPKSLAMNATEENFKFLSSGVKGYTLTVEYDKNNVGVVNAEESKEEETKLVNNLTSGEAFATLADAFAASANGDVLELQGDVVVDATLSNIAQGVVTIKSAGEETYTITRGGDVTMFNAQGRTGSTQNTINLENVKINGDNVESTNPLITIGAQGLVGLTNVEIQNGVNTGAETAGLINVAYQGNLNVTDVTINGGNLGDNNGDIRTTGTVNLLGVCNFSAFIDTRAGMTGSVTLIKLTDKGMTDGLVTIYFDPEEVAKVKTKTAVAGQGQKPNADLYACGVEGYNFVADNMNLNIEELPCVAVIGETKYATLADALAASVSGDVIELQSDVVVDATLSNIAGLVTIKSAGEETYTITRGADVTMFNAEGRTGSTQNTINLENVKIDGDNVESTNPLITIGAQGLVGLTNVEIQNGVNTGAETAGLINVAYQGNLNVTDVTINGGNLGDNNGDIRTTGTVNLLGVCNFSAFIDTRAGMTGSVTLIKLTDKGMTDGLVTIYFDPEEVAKVKTKTAVAGQGQKPNANLYACGVEGYNFVADNMNLNIEELPCVAVIGETKYATLADALAASVNGDVIELQSDVVVDATLANIAHGVVTIKSAGEETYTITRGADVTMFNAEGRTSTGAQNTINLENVKIDGADVASEAAMMTIGAQGAIGLTNVEIVNAANSTETGLVNVAKSSTLNVNGLTVSDSKIAANSGDVYNAGGTVNVTGECNFSAYLLISTSGTGSTTMSKLTDKGVTGGEISILFDAEKIENVKTKTAVNAQGVAANTAYYVCGVEGYEFKINGSNIVVEAQTVGIDEVAGDVDADAPVSVYNLQGIAVRVNVAASEALTDLPAGIYIVNGKKYLVK